MITRTTIILKITIFTLYAFSLFADTIVWDFNDVGLGSIPDGWQTMSGETSPNGATVTSDGSPTVTWEAVEDATSPDTAADNRVMAVTKHNGSVYAHGHHCWTNEIEFSDGTIEVDMVGRDTEKGHMGVSFRIKDNKTFYAIRFQAANGDLQTIDVNDGNIQYRTSQASTNLQGFDTWRKLKVEVAGNNIKVSVNGQQYIDYTDTSDPITEAGGVGLFARGDVSIVSFDRLTVSGDDITSINQYLPNIVMEQMYNQKSSVVMVYNIRGQLLGILGGDHTSPFDFFIRGNSALHAKPARGIFILSEKQPGRHISVISVK